MTPKLRWLAREVLEVFVRERGIIESPEAMAGLAASLALVACKVTQRGTLVREMFLHEFVECYRMFCQDLDREAVYGAPPTEKGMVRVPKQSQASADDLPDMIRLDPRSKRLLALAVRGSTEGERVAASLAFVRRIAR